MCKRVGKSVKVSYQQTWREGLNCGDIITLMEVGNIEGYFRTFAKQRVGCEKRDVGSEESNEDVGLHTSKSQLLQHSETATSLKLSPHDAARVGCDVSDPNPSLPSAILVAHGEDWKLSVPTKVTMGSADSTGAFTVIRDKVNQDDTLAINETSCRYTCETMTLSRGSSCGSCVSVGDEHSQTSVDESSLDQTASYYTQGFESLSGTMVDGQSPARPSHRLHLPNETLRPGKCPDFKTTKNQTSGKLQRPNRLHKTSWYNKQRTCRAPHNQVCDADHSPLHQSTCGRWWSVEVWRLVWVLPLLLLPGLVLADEGKLTRPHQPS